MKSVFVRVEMTFGLIHASYSNMQAVKLTFFVPGDDGDDDYDYIKLVWSSTCQIGFNEVMLMMVLFIHPLTFNNDDSLNIWRWEWLC